MCNDMIGRNNPWNVRYDKRNKWRGQIGHTRGFVNFAGVDFCCRAVCHLIMRSYRIAGAYCLSAIIERYAPPSENNTANYLKFVCDYTRMYTTYVPKCNEDIAKIVTAMYFYETGSREFTSYNEEYVLGIIKSFNLKFYYK